MIQITVNINEETVTINNETCNFQEAGLYTNDSAHKAITDRDEIREHLNDTNDFPHQVVFETELTDEQKEKVIEIAKKAYELPQSYNTDLYLVDGEIVKLDHHGGTILQKYDEVILCIKSSDTQNYCDMMREDLTEEQRAFVEEQNWLSIEETNSNEKEDWIEFSINDDSDFESNILEEIEKNLQAV